VRPKALAERVQKAAKTLLARYQEAVEAATHQDHAPSRIRPAVPIKTLGNV
jgi:hypothetical protein